MTYNPNEHDTVIRYSPYEVILCETNQDGVTQLHPNGQPRLFSYSNDGVNDILNEACDDLNKCDEDDQHPHWVQPIPMGQKPINRKNLVWLLRTTYDCVRSAVRGLEVVGRNLKQAIEEVDSDA